MKRALWFLIIPGLVLAQAAPRTRSSGEADAGVTVIRLQGDGGVTTDSPTRTSSPPSPTELRKEVSELRARVAELEQRLEKAERAAASAEKLEKRLATLEARVDEAQQEKENAERELATRKQNHQQASTTVQGVLQQLSLGNTSNVDGWLRTVEEQYSGNAAKLVSLARDALRRSDLNAARQYLSLALLEPAP